MALQNLNQFCHVSYEQDDRRFTSQAWNRLFRIKEQVIREYVIEFLSSFTFRDHIEELDIADTMVGTMGRRSVIRQKGLRFVEVHLIGMIASYYGLNTLASLMNVTLGSMIGSLMYLTASRLDIMFVVYACDRFQVTPKVSHLHAMKRIFRYLKGQPKLGLWYPRDSSFDLEAFSDSDYARASLDRKSTTGSCQFLGKRLISWKCKKQTVVSNLTTKAEYVAAANCYRQTNTVRTVDNGEQEITSTVDGKEFTITEASIRRHLQLADVEGNYIAPNLTPKLFSNMKRGFSEEHIHLFPSMLAIQAEEGKGSGHPSEPQPPPSIAQPNNEEPIPNVVSLSHQKTQTPRQALNHVIELPQTSEPIPNVPDEAIYEKWDDIVERATTTAASLDAKHASGGSPRCQEAMGVPLLRLEIQGLHGQEMEFEIKVYTTEDVSIAGAAVTTTGASISTASPLRVSTAEDISTAKTLVYIRMTAAKYKGKAKMDESEPEQTKTKLQQRQERAGYESAVRLQEQLDEEERKIISRVHEEASSFNIEEWEDIIATIEADEELAQRIQAEEREKYSEAEKARLLAELIKQREIYFAQQRAEERSNKPLTQAQQRTYMSNYIKHTGSHTLQQLKRLSFDELKNLFELEVQRGVQKKNLIKGVLRGKRLVKTQNQLKNQKREDDKLSQEELQQLMIIVPEEGMNAEALQTKYPIID
ncbi:hypothetical protein Tco_0980011 [Tanacetum coccineum]